MAICICFNRSSSASPAPARRATGRRGRAEAAAAPSSSSLESAFCIVGLPSSLRSLQWRLIRSARRETMGVLAVDEAFDSPPFERSSSRRSRAFWRSSLRPTEPFT